MSYEVTHGLSRVRVTLCRVLSTIICVSLFLHLVIVLPVLCLNLRFLFSTLAPSNSSYYHWLDVTTGEHYVPEDIICPVAFNCMS